MIKKRDFSPTGYLLLAASATMLLFLTIPVGAQQRGRCQPIYWPPSHIREFEVDYGMPCRVEPSYLNVSGE